MNALDTTAFGSITGLALVAIGEVFGLAFLTLLGVVTFTAFFLATFPVMARDLLVGTSRERHGSESILEQSVRPR